MKIAKAPPNRGEFELTLFGPGYGECIVVHAGDGIWVIVDSCIDETGTPRALRYLEDINVDAADAVRLIVATHWHDDHIRGMARLVKACASADFCCAAALCRKEFLKISAVLGRHFMVDGSGTDEISTVFSRLRSKRATPTYAKANCRIFARNGCEIWSLSPSDESFETFLEAVRGLMPSEGDSKRRIPDLSPNKAAVALWIEIDDVSVLLGSDLECNGWMEILRSGARPAGRASAFKIPHHGSGNADEPMVWRQMLDPQPFAMLAPWQRGSQTLPRPEDVDRILSNTANAWSSARADSMVPRTVRRRREVERTIRESDIRLRELPESPGIVRLRREIGEQASWNVELSGMACRLEDFFGE